LREALGPKKLISAAVPGLPRDMLAFTRDTVPHIMQYLDFLNVMTYDLMNRRDTLTKHHSDIDGSLTALDAYIANGAAPESLNLGFAFYVKYFRTQHDPCQKPASSIGCPTLLLEDPETGADLGRAGAFSWHDTVPQDVAASFSRALIDGAYDEQRGGYYYWDEQEDLWWTFDTVDSMSRKFSSIVDTKRLGGVFAWGLGEDGPKFEHFKAVSNAMAMRRPAKDEL
jgi:GH18 family chitinase